MFFRSFLAASVMALVGSGCSAAQSFCQKQEECAEEILGEEGADARDDANDDDPDDNVAVCTAFAQGNLDALRANEEEDCRVLADAQEAFQACMGGLSCNDLEDEFSSILEDGEGDKCEDQFDDLNDAQEGAANDNCFG